MIRLQYKSGHSLTDKPFCVRFSRPFSSSHIAGRPLFGDPHLKCFTRRGRSKKFQHFRSQRYKSSLTSRCNVKGNIIGGIKGFLASKASINFIDKLLLKFRLLSTLLVLEKVVYLIWWLSTWLRQQIPAFASLLSLWLSSFLVFSPSQTCLISPSE